MDEGNSKGPLWLKFLNTNGGTALISVLVGGIFGQFVTCTVQRGNAEREFQREWLQARGQQALLAYDRYLSEGLDQVESAFSEVGTIISSSENLAALADPIWYPEQYQGDSRKRVEDERQQILHEFNETVTRWQREKETIGLMIGYYFNTNEFDVAEEWRDVQRNVDAYIVCAKGRYFRSVDPDSESPLADCVKEKTAARDAVLRFTDTLESTRTYVWVGWSDIDELRRVLKEAPLR